MLGPALTQLFGRLSAIPERERTTEQKAQLSELALLFASTPDHPRPAHLELDTQLRAKLHGADMRLFAITEPYDPPPQTPLVRCNVCQQAFPIMTQPKGSTGSGP
jgi:hypothetical protein